MGADTADAHFAHIACSILIGKRSIPAIWSRAAVAAAVGLVLQRCTHDIGRLIGGAREMDALINTHGPDIRSQVLYCDVPSRLGLVGDHSIVNDRRLGRITADSDGAFVGGDVLIGVGLGLRRVFDSAAIDTGGLRRATRNVDGGRAIRARSHGCGCYKTKSG